VIATSRPGLHRERSTSPRPACVGAAPPTAGTAARPAVPCPRNRPRAACALPPLFGSTLSTPAQPRPRPVGGIPLRDPLGGYVPATLTRRPLRPLSVTRTSARGRIRALQRPANSLNPRAELLHRPLAIAKPVSFCEDSPPASPNVSPNRAASPPQSPAHLPPPPTARRPATNDSPARKAPSRRPSPHPRPRRGRSRQDPPC